MKILVVEPLKVPYEKEIDGSLESMQAVVGGLIQLLYPFEDSELALICNDEGKILGLPYEGGYYNVIVTQYELDDLKSYLNNNTVVYDKKKTNGKYQVGSGRIVTVTQNTPFVEDIVPQIDESVKRKFSPKQQSFKKRAFNLAAQFADRPARVDAFLLVEASLLLVGYGRKLTIMRPR